MRRDRLQNFLYILAALASLFGLIDAIYLTVQHLTGQNVECIASVGCETVLASHYATIARVPLAAIGATAYFAVFSLATLAAFRQAHAREFFLVLVASMFGVTCWLLYIQAFILHAFCDYCLLSAGLVGVLTMIAIAIFFIARKRSRLSGS